MKKSKAKELKRYDQIIGDRKMYELSPSEKTRPVSKEIGELCRHRLEKRWYRRLVILNILIIAIVVGLFVKNISKNSEIAKNYVEQIQSELKETVSAEKNSSDEETEEQETKVEDTKNSKTASSKEIESIDDFPFEVKYLCFGVLALVVTFLGLYYMYAKYRANSVRITEKNFPEVYRTIEEYANRLGIAVPKAYVIQTGGTLNAFSTFLFKRQWIAIHSELLEVAYREHKDMESLSFVIAHEMAHIYYKHATFLYNFAALFAMQIPIIGTTASRAREYSCDRLAQLLTGASGVEAMLVLAVDRHVYKLVDQEDYLSEMKNTKGFFVWYSNLLADHPVLSKRVVALYEGRGSGDLY